MFTECCGHNKKSDSDYPKNKKTKTWVIGYKTTPIGDIPLISSELTWDDIKSSWKMRWALKRDYYSIDPGIYGIGNPDESSPVLVTANYKLTFDKVRKELKDHNLWIVVLDTRGVNVWCAAGKGTFGTEELIHRLEEINLKDLVNHKRIILPQLGAVGVAAHEVTKKTGFSVKYGPVLAKDIPQYITNRFKKTEEMRDIPFSFLDRLVLVPIELSGAKKISLQILAVVLLVSLIDHGGLNIKVLHDLVPFVGAILAGIVLGPLMLPVLPTRSFAIKGMFLGIVLTIGCIFLFELGVITSAFYLLVLPPIVSFFTLNYTGSTTFTSLAGVKLEVTIATPVYLNMLGLGVVLKSLNLLAIV